MLKKIEKNKKVIIIPDIHQDAYFLAKVMANKACDNFDAIVFLGDYFDTHNEEKNTVSKTVDVLKYYHYLYSHKDVNQKVYWLVGNHDLTYLEDYNHRTRYSKQFHCGGYSKERSSYITKNLNIGFWADTEIAIQVGDYILSHAGFHQNHFKPFLNVFGQISEINRIYKHNFLNPSAPEISWLWNIGRHRGGNSSVGSPIWLDFDFEFKDMVDFPQIVGHTAGNSVKKIGNSVCLDCLQTSFGILQNNQLQTFLV